MKRRGKKYKAAKQQLGKRTYLLGEAIGLLKKTSVTKFDSTCEVHAKLGIDVKQADQMVRGTVALPHGTGKKVKVIAFVTEALEKQAKEAGAMDAGLHLVEKIAGGWLDFDIAVATPDVMKGLGKIAKTLGQKGLMPNPKAGTVTTEVKKTIAEILKGKVEFRADKQGLLHNAFGKVSFSEEQLTENLKTFIRAMLQSKPKGTKGTYVESLTVTTTMGPGVRLDVNKAIAETNA